MAKVSMLKLGLTKNTKVTTIKHNEQEIEVKEYLPINDKIKYTAEVVAEATMNDDEFINPLKLSVFLGISIIKAYTNINLTEKQLEDPAKLYDLFVGSELLEEVEMAIPKEELKVFVNGIWDVAEAYDKYRNSLWSIMEAINQDYDNLDLESKDIQENLSNKENLKFVKDVLSKLG